MVLEGHLRTWERGKKGVFEENGENDLSIYHRLGAPKISFSDRVKVKG